MPRPSNSCYSEGTGRTGQLSFCKDIQVLQKKKNIKKYILLFKDLSPVP